MYRRRCCRIALWVTAGCLAFALGVAGGYSIYSHQKASASQSEANARSSSASGSSSKSDDGKHKDKNILSSDTGSSPSADQAHSAEDDAAAKDHEDHAVNESGHAYAEIANSVASIEQYYGAQVQVAWVSEGGVQSAGNLTDLPAWSTSKVPLAMAAINAGLGAQQSGNITAAIRASDNAAAEALWQVVALDDASRAAAVTNILRLAGDSSTTVPSVRTFGSYTIFGQTQWAAADQVQFLMRMESLPGGVEVKEHMRGAYANQRWGIGRWEGSAVKGGWGPTRFGGYTARQMGWYWRDGVEVPIAIAAQAGSFDAAVGVVDAVAALFQ